MSDSEKESSGLLLFLKGILMGLGDSVPGISGGTIAVLTNIYDKLIYSISAVNMTACQHILRGRFKQFWQHINGSFLLTLALGILVGLLISAYSVLFLLENHFELLMAFFIGLVLASIPSLRRQVELSQPVNCLALILGISLVVGFGMLSPQTGQITYLTLFISGAIGISAMILPGLSGAFILLLLGVYQFILAALISFDVPSILVFSAGCGVGILAFSQLLAWCLRHYHQRCYGFITGMLLGSITVLWPWQLIDEIYTDSSGEVHALQTTNQSPFDYYELTGNDPRIFYAVLCMFAGMAVVNLLQHSFKSSSTVSH